MSKKSFNSQNRVLQPYLKTSLIVPTFLFILSVPESINSDYNTSPLFIFQIAKKTMFLKLMASLSLSMNISQEDLGQAQDMFSRTFQIQIYQYFLPNIVWFVCLDFLKCLNLRKIVD